MATKTAVLDSNQGIEDQPRTFLRRSMGDLLVRRGIARRLGRNLIQYYEAKTIKILPCAVGRTEQSGSYIPDRLPPAELPGVIFVPPTKVADYSFLERLNSTRIVRSAHA